MSDKKWEREFSAGGLVYRRAGSGIEVLLIMPNKWNEHAPTGKWRLPKGLIDAGEKSEAAAIREVFEETGIRGVIERDLGEEKFCFRVADRNIFKIVRFFLMSFESGEPTPDPLEVFEAKWFSIDQAISLLAYKGERDLVVRAKETLLS